MTRQQGQGVCRRIREAGQWATRRPSWPELAGDGAKPLGAGRAKLSAPHAKRVVRVILDERVLGSAAEAFAAGEIDRAELMRRISR